MGSRLLRAHSGLAYRRVTGWFVALLPGLLFAGFVVWPALLKFGRFVSPGKPDNATIQSKWAPIGSWLARGLPGALLAGYISWMTMPRVQSIKPRMVALADKPIVFDTGTAWLSKLSKLISLALTAIAALLLLVFILWMTLPRVFNLQALIVLTGSMEPAMPVGSVAFVNKTGAGAVEVGDVITFERQANGRQVLITHRVIEVVPDEIGLAFRTQGDANSAPDEWVVPGELVVGEVTRVIPYVGYLTDKVRGRNGFLALMAIPGAVIIIGEVRKIGHELRVMRQKDSAA